MKNIALIMAGGKGERFWPKSRRSCPKQFLSLTKDGKTMLQLTVERLISIVDWNDIFIVTNSRYLNLIKEQLPLLLEENILLEPMAKNTAPCIGYAVAHIKKKYSDATMIVLPSDHLIMQKELYLNTLKQAVNVAKTPGSIVAIGITPTHPETGYGYINFEICDKQDYNVYSVKQFVEKPTLDKAREYIDQGTYLWNSGMYIFSLKTILGNFQKYLPNIYEGIVKIEEAISKDDYEDIVKYEFEKFTSESIDTGIMEKSDRICVLPGSFGWNDVGSWTSLEKINSVNENGNIISGNTIAIDVNNCIIQADKKLFAIIGIDDIIVVDSDDATLICAKSKAQEIKKVIENLKICNREEYL